MRNLTRRSTRRNRDSAGITLIEMMVAMAISLLMMAAVAQLFASVSASVSASRASITLSESLRSASKKLQNDLAGVTATMQPPRRPELGEGYFEFKEGPNNDSTAYATTNATANTAGLTLATGGAINTLSGDTDDILMFTTRSKDGQPFVGKFYNSGTNSIVTIESQTAEVVWFAYENGQTVPIPGANNTFVQAPLYTLYRRLLLVAPEYNASAKASGLTGKPFFNAYDLSAHFDTSNNVMVLNTLGDLTKRENRFAHFVNAKSTNIPYPVYLPVATAGNAIVQGLEPFDGNSVVSSANPTLTRVGEDVVLTNVLAFDVRVYDPSAPLYQAGDGATALSPSDVGYWTAVANGAALLGYGDFVDLGYGCNMTTGNAQSGATVTPSNPTGSSLTLSAFSGLSLIMPANGASNRLSEVALIGGSLTAVYYPTYDTWSQHYEDAGPWNMYINFLTTPSNPSNTISGSNGFDDDNNGVVDDPVTPPGPGVAAAAGEQQYPPPYPVPLRGIQVKIRTYEPDSKQVREVTITQDFLPQ